MGNIVKLWLLFGFWFYSGNLFAAQRWFQIELIVFTQSYGSNEQFDQQDSQIQWPRGIAELSSSTQALSVLRQSPIAFAQVQSGDRLLNQSYASLKNSRNYQPLLHVSWIQAVGANQLSDAVHIQSAQLNGFVRIQRGSYLHLLADLEYSPGQSVYRIKEKRRFKFNETHYLDHPKFGVIARVRPL